MANNVGKRAGIREKTAVKRKKAFDLRVMGHPYAEIAKAVGCSKSRAHSLVTEYLDELHKETKENAHRVLAMEIHRLDKLLTKALRRLEEEWSDKTAELVLKIQSRRSNYLGLDQAKKVSFSASEISDNDLKNQVQALMQRQTASSSSEIKDLEQTNSSTGDEPVH